MPCHALSYHIMPCTGDLSEIRMSIAEARNQLFGGYFVKQLLIKAMDSNQPSVCQQLVKLLREETVAVYLSNCKAEVEAALRGMEEIKMLADTVLDCSNVSTKLVYGVMLYLFRIRHRDLCILLPSGAGNRWYNCTMLSRHRSCHLR